MNIKSLCLLASLSASVFLTGCAGPTANLSKAPEYSDFKWDNKRSTALNVLKASGNDDPLYDKRLPKELRKHYDSNNELLMVADSAMVGASMTSSIGIGGLSNLGGLAFGALSFITSESKEDTYTPYFIFYLPYDESKPLSHYLEMTNRRLDEDFAAGLKKTAEVQKSWIEAFVDSVKVDGATRLYKGHITRHTRKTPFKAYREVTYAKIELLDAENVPKTLRHEAKQFIMISARVEGNMFFYVDMPYLSQYTYYFGTTWINKAKAKIALVSNQDKEYYFFKPE